MENVYTSYSRKIDATTYFFVKKFLVFPDLKTIPPILEGYGMHIDFNQACIIAGIKDAEIKKQLFAEMETGQKQAKVIDLNEMGLKHKTAGL